MGQADQAGLGSLSAGAVNHEFWWLTNVERETAPLGQRAKRLQMVVLDARSLVAARAT
jgi:hypothetical protein